MKGSLLKNNAEKKIMAVILCAALGMSSLTACDSVAKNNLNNDIENKSEEELEENILESAIEEHMGVHTETDSGKVTKEETVYVIADASGNANEILVSDWIKNAKAEGGLTDLTDLTDIENTSGNEIYTDDGSGKLYWTANGNDIHYKGKSDKELPVDVKVSYYLDGQEMGPDEIAGKNGYVTIRFDYSNNAKTTIMVGDKEEEIYVPFAMISGLIMDSSKFSNISVSNGRVISEGGKNIAVGIAFPGLEESLDLNGIKDKAEGIDSDSTINDLQIPDYVEISAYTVNFEIGQTMTVAATDVLTALNTTSDKINTDNMENSISELSDGMEQLTDGSVQLNDGAAELMDGARTLAEKSEELDEGAKELDEGAKELDDGAFQLQDGAKKVDDGTAELLNGTVALNDGTTQLVEGVGTLKDGTQALKDGTSALKAGFEGENGAIYGAQRIAEGSSLLNDAVQNASAPSLSDEDKAAIQNTGAQGAAEYAGSFASGIVYGDGTNPGLVDSLVNTVVDAVFGGIESNIAASKDTTVQGVGQAAAGSIESQIMNGEGAGYDLYLALQAAGKSSDEAAYIVAAFASGVAENTASQVIDGVGSKILESKDGTAEQVSEQAKPVVENMLTQSLTGPLSQLGGGIALQVATTIMNQVANATLATMTELGNATKQLADGAQQLVNGLVQLYSGTAQVDDGLGQLYTGVDSLQDGAYAINNGACALKLGAIELKGGTTQLYDGTVTFKEGTFALKDGTAQLYDGTKQFVTGTNQLYDGTRKLSDGTLELMDGVMRFDEEGISKLTEVFGEDVSDAIDRIQAVINSGSSYTIYTDVADGVDSSVKFIYKTDAVKVK